MEHVFIVTLDGCPVCEKAKEDLPEITKGVEFVEISTPQGQEITKQLTITKVPTCVIGIETGSGNMHYEYCDDLEKQKQFD